MFDSGGVDGVLKVIDFGSSVFVQDAEMVRAMPYCPPPLCNLRGQGTHARCCGCTLHFPHTAPSTAWVRPSAKPTSP